MRSRLTWTVICGFIFMAGLITAEAINRRIQEESFVPMTAVVCVVPSAAGTGDNAPTLVAQFPSPTFHPESILSPVGVYRLTPGELCMALASAEDVKIETGK